MSFKVMLMPNKTATSSTVQQQDTRVSRPMNVWGLGSERLSTAGLIIDICS